MSLSSRTSEASFPVIPHQRSEFPLSSRTSEASSLSSRMSGASVGIYSP
jgi:hypothetical protein